MQYYSLNKKADKSSFENAVKRGLAPDRGLYFPEKITALDAQFFKEFDQLSNSEIAFYAIRQFMDQKFQKQR